MVYNTRKKKRYVTVQNYDHEDHGKSKDSALGPRSLSCICQKKELDINCCCLLLLS